MKKRKLELEKEKENVVEESIEDQEAKLVEHDEVKGPETACSEKGEEKTG